MSEGEAAAPVAELAAGAVPLALAPGGDPRVPAPASVRGLGPPQPRRNVMPKKKQQASVKRPKLYENLRKKGLPKAAAARIANAGRKKRRGK